METTAINTVYVVYVLLDDANQKWVDRIYQRFDKAKEYSKKFNEEHLLLWSYVDEVLLY